MSNYKLMEHFFENFVFQCFYKKKNSQNFQFKGDFFKGENLKIVIFVLRLNTKHFPAAYSNLFAVIFQFSHSKANQEKTLVFS